MEDEYWEEEWEDLEEFEHHHHHHEHEHGEEEILSESDKAFIKQKFQSELKGEVDMMLIVSEACDYCELTRRLLEIFSELSGGKINLKVKDIREIPMAEKVLGVDRGPIILIGKNGEVRYTGAPLGEEGWAFLETIVMASNGRHGFDAVVDELRSLDRKVRIETIITPTCPYCPHAVLLANRIALASKGKVVSDTVEAYEFPEIADKFRVTAVPTVVLSVEKPYSGRVFMVGVPHEKQLIRAILKLGVED